MAEFKEKFFGKVSGAFGDFIGVVRGDDNYLMKKKANRKVDNSAEGKERRHKFGTAIKASKVITSVNNIKAIWKEKSAPNQSAYNYCIQYNYNNVDGSGTKTGFSLFPGIGFAFSIDTFNKTESEISVAILPLANSTIFDNAVEKNIEAYFVIELNDPNKPEGDKVMFFAKTSVSQSLDLNNTLTFTVNLHDTENSIIESFASAKVHVAFCTLNESGEPIQFSATSVQS